MHGIRYLISFTCSIDCFATIANQSFPIDALAFALALAVVVVVAHSRIILRNFGSLDIAGVVDSGNNKMKKAQVAQKRFKASEGVELLQRTGQDALLSAEWD